MCSRVSTGSDVRRFPVTDAPWALETSGGTACGWTRLSEARGPWDSPEALSQVRDALLPEGPGALSREGGGKHTPAPAHLPDPLRASVLRL